MKILHMIEGECIMKSFSSMSKEELSSLKSELSAKYDEFKAKDLKLDMSRASPGKSSSKFHPDARHRKQRGAVQNTDGVDCRNYGLLDGIPSIKALFSKMLGVDARTSWSAATRASI